MSSTTQRNKNLLNDITKLERRYSTAEEFLIYLNNPNHFKKLNKVLKETMIKVGVCQDTDEDEVFENELYSRLKAQNTIYAMRTVERWINGDSPSFENRETAFNICFALKLDINLTDEFLNKCCYGSFNVRNAVEFTYYYCIRKKKPLSVAKEIIAKYNKAETETAESEIAKPADFCGTTTQYLRKICNDENWADDEEFLTQFLIPNKRLFIGHSKTAEKEYYYWKNILWSIVIEKELDDSAGEHADQDDHNEKWNYRRYNKFINQIKKFNDKKSPLFNDSSSPVYSLYSMYTQKRPDEELVRELKRIVKNATGLESSKKISDFLKMIINPNEVLENILTFARDREESRQQRQSVLLFDKKESSLYKNKKTESGIYMCLDSVMNEFPYKDEFNAYEKNPEIAEEKISVRKIIILLYFACYSFEYVDNFDSNPPKSDIIKKFGYENFIDQINEILQKCNLPRLYYANQFDLLILRCIREFSFPSYGDAIDFFGEIIESSYNKRTRR